jgi:hypothetical protein
MGKIMSLPACQQRVLDHIENTLQHREPRLASMFAMFTRLTKNEGAPRTETLEQQRWWVRARGRLRRAGRPGVALRAVFLVPLAALLVVTAVLIGMSSSGLTCPPSAGPHGSAATQSHARNCTAASKYAPFGHSP